MNLLYTFLSFTCISLFSFGSYAQNTSWITSLEEAKVLASQENKNILLEIGAVQDNFPLFIPDHIWGDEMIVKKLHSFIPASIDIKNEPALKEQYDVYYAPYLLCLTPSGEVIYKSHGDKNLFELDDILTSLSRNTKKITQLKGIYEDTDGVGNLLLLEEYVKLGVKSPDHMENDIQDRINEILANIEKNETSYNPVQAQRLKILKSLVQVYDYSTSKGLKALYKLGKKDLFSSNHSLLLFAISVAEDYDGDFEKATRVYRELEKRKAQDSQASSFCKILAETLEIEEK